VSVAGLSFVVGIGVGRLPPVARRFATVADIPASYWKRTPAMTMRGRCVSVSDGDTIRVLHTPTLFHGGRRCKASVKLSESTLAIRICTVDTPETAKFGKPGQPFGNEAHDFLSGLLQDQMVSCRLLQKDQYGRAVAEVSTRPSWWIPWRRRKYADQELLRAGLAQVYVGSGAVYGHLGADHYQKLQEAARQSRLGIWSEAHHESAAAYKARTKA
jgi:micrococcal nuclease